MKRYGAFEAKTHFSELLEKVSHGETCVITKHGVEVALITPFKKEALPPPSKEAIQAIRKGREGLTLGKKLSIKKLRAEGRH